MTRAIGALISLYPKPWRARYQREFAAMLEDAPPTWRTFFDVLGGAIKMQLKTGSAWKIVGGFAVVGLAVAASALFWIPTQYQSTAVIKLVDTNADQLSSIAQNIESRSFLTQLILEEDLYKVERARIPMEELVAQMQTKAIVIRPVPSVKDGAVTAFTITFISSDPGEAHRVTDRLASAFIDAKSGHLLDPASIPTSPSSPRRSRILIFGLLTGLAVGGLVALFTGLRVWKLAPALGVAGMLVSVVPWYFVNNLYTSTAILRFHGPDRTESLNQMKGAVETLTSKQGLDRIAQAWHLEPQKLRERLRVQVLPNTSAVMVQFEGTDRYQAQKIVADVSSRLVEESMREAQRLYFRRAAKDFLATGLPQEVGATLELLYPPSLPLNPTYPKRIIPAGIGLLIGISAALMIGMRRVRRVTKTA